MSVGRSRLGERLTRDADCRALEITYKRLFHPENPGYFHVSKGNSPGIHDGTQGVQWNAYHDHIEDRVILGANLEGERYDGWPIGRSIRRELDEPTLPAVATDVARQLVPGEDVRLLIWRDTWINERSKKGDSENERDLPARDRTPERWQQVLMEARGYLADGGLGRRPFPSPRQDLSTSPQFQGATTAWVAMPATYDERMELMSAARTRLERFHDWALRRSEP